MRKALKTALVGRGCVACGCCAGICPVGAISVYKGLYAVVDTGCLGCGKCVKNCPADVITLVNREDEPHEKTLV